MGLDNFPHSYPCRTQDTAVMVYRLDRNGDKIKDENGVFDKQIDWDRISTHYILELMMQRNLYESDGDVFMRNF